MILSNVTNNALRSYRLNEAADHYASRLSHARLKRSELREIADIYARLDAERGAAGLPSAERAPWSPADILEWQDLTPTERYLDLKGYAAASDPVAGIAPPLDCLPRDVKRVGCQAAPFLKEV